MSFQNPTPVTLGLTGDFLGRRYRVVGRVVLGEQEGGDTYYWNEFNLLGDDGNSATLVYEVTDGGGQWRFFTLFDPKNPLSVAEAAGKQVGDTINLEGRPLPVTLVSESRVYDIEGQAPEGEAVGNVACYFNAEHGDVMVVVSWTGDEIEFYRGVDLPRGVVTAAFGLPKEQTGFFAGSSWRNQTPRPALPNWLRRFVPALVILLVALVWGGSGGRFWSCRSHARTKPALPAAPLSLGMSGTLERSTWHVRGHAIAEISEVGQLYDRHEYQLVNEAGHQALLVFGTKTGARDWVLFRPVQPAVPLTPVQAAAKRVGDEFDLGSTPATITGILLSILRRTEAQDLPDFANGTVFYGFTARSGAGPILVRWSANDIIFYLGQFLSAKEVQTAFGPQTAR